MSSRKVLAAVLAVVAVVLGIAVIAPGLGLLGGEDQVANDAPSPVDTVRIDGGRLIMPAAAGNPAALYFDATNTGEAHAHLTAVALQSGARGDFRELREAAEKPQANVEIAPGETVRLGPGGIYAAITDFGSDVVPGATVNAEVTLSDGSKVTFPARVEVAEALQPGNQGRSAAE